MTGSDPGDRDRAGNRIRRSIAVLIITALAAAAAAFLRAHRGRISLITIDIGANDPNPCIAHPTLSNAASCVGSRIPGVIGGLATILRTLRAAGGSKVRIIGMSYYVPELAQW